jgi:hypothetical protein
MTNAALSEDIAIKLEGAALPNPPQPHMYAEHSEQAESQRDPNAEVDQLAPRRQRGDPLHDEFKTFLGCEARLVSAVGEWGNVVWHADGMPENGGSIG